jgi:hypothetical protein
MKPFTQHQEILDMECKKFVYGGLPNNSFEGTTQIWVRFSERVLPPNPSFHEKGNENNEVGTGFFCT